MDFTRDQILNQAFRIGELVVVGFGSGTHIYEITEASEPGVAGADRAPYSTASCTARRVTTSAGKKNYSGGERRFWYRDMQWKNLRSGMFLEDYIEELRKEQEKMKGFFVKHYTKLNELSRVHKQEQVEGRADKTATTREAS